MHSSVSGILACKTSKQRTKAVTKPTTSSEQKWQRKILLALLVLSLPVTQSGCATEPVTVTKTVREEVPAALLSPCPKASGAKTYEDAIRLAEERGVQLDECNKRLGDISRWSAGSP
jgi:hypothetical protein